MKKKIENNEWYLERAGIFDSFYLKEVAQIISPARTKQEVNFIKKSLDLRLGANILDLACGHGRHVIELAKQGYQVIGQDINSCFLGIAQKEAKKLNLKIQFINADMRRIPFKDKFDAVLLLFNSFGYFRKEADHQKVINEISKALKPKGRLLLDLGNCIRAKKLKNNERKSQLEKNLIAIRKRNYNSTTKRLEQEIIRIEKGKSKKSLRISIRIFSISELRAMLKKGNLKIKKIFGGYKKVNFSKESKRLIILAQKK